MGEGPVQLSLCIVSWNCRDDLLACLASLQDARDGVDVEVLVVDNASADGTVAEVGARFPAVRVIANAGNRGFAAATNQALAEARGRYLLLLNPDTLLPPGGLAALVEVAETHPGAGLIGPKLLNPDGSLQHSCRRFPTVAAGLFRHTILGRLFPRNHWSAEYVMADWAHDQAREVDWLSGACMLVRRELYEAIGPLDEGFFWGSEDVDYCYRAHAAGSRVLYSPQPAVIHKIGASTNQAPVKTIIRFHRSMARLYRKHLARNAFEWALVSAGVTVRAGLLIASLWLRMAQARVIQAWRGGG